VSTAVGTSCLAGIAIGEQIPLFDVGVNLSEVSLARAEVLSHAHAVNTVRGYGYSWATFARWCAAAGRQALPASCDTVSLFSVWGCFKRRPRPYALSHVRHVCSAVRDRHRSEGLPSPITDVVRETLAGIARSTDQESEAKEALSPSQLRAAVGVLSDAPIGRRDGAILLVGFTTGWRSCELAGLNLREVRFEETCMRFKLRRSKSDQEGKGREVKIPRVPDSGLCPVSALEAWLKVRGGVGGPLFQTFRNGATTGRRIAPDLVNDIVHDCLRKAGIDPRAYGSHSLRAGMVTTAAEAGADLIAIQERTGHARLETLAKYIRSRGGFPRDPLAGVL
jgi:integrase